MTPTVFGPARQGRPPAPRDGPATEQREHTAGRHRPRPAAAGGCTGRRQSRPSLPGGGTRRHAGPAAVPARHPVPRWRARLAAAPGSVRCRVPPPSSAAPTGRRPAPLPAARTGTAQPSAADAAARAADARQPAPPAHRRLRVTAEREIGLDPVLDRACPQFFQPGDLRLRERLIAEIGQRRAPPQRQRLAKLRRRLAGRVRRERPPPLPGETLEQRTSNARPRPAAGTHPAASAPPGPRGRLQRLAQPRDVHLQGVLGARGGCSPHNWSTRRHGEPAGSRRSSRIASSARCFRPPISRPAR